jgi:hypothetical protein
MGLALQIQETVAGQEVAGVLEALAGLGLSFFAMQTQGQ